VSAGESVSISFVHFENSEKITSNVQCTAQIAITRVFPALSQRGTYVLVLAAGSVPLLFQVAGILLPCFWHSFALSPSMAGSRPYALALVSAAYFLLPLRLVKASGFWGFSLACINRMVHLTLPFLSGQCRRAPILASII
jgi:hypothetical protein